MRFIIMTFTAIVSLLLMGCERLIPPLTPVNPPANAAQHCPKLQRIDENADMGGLLRFTHYVIAEYNDCAARHDALIGFVTSN